MSNTPFQIQTESKQKYIRDQSNQNFRSKIFFLKNEKRLKENDWEIILTRQTGSVPQGS